MDAEFLRDDWDSEWRPHRDLVAWTLGLVAMDGPGLGWLYMFLDAFRSAESRAMWFRPTPTRGASVFEQNAVMVAFFVFWTVLVLAVFARPLGETLREVRG